VSLVYTLHLIRSLIGYPFQGLRELLEISWKNGSMTQPLAGPRLVSCSCQTEEAELRPAVVTTVIPEASTFAAASSSSACSSSSQVPSSSSVDASTSFPDDPSSPARPLARTSALSPDHYRGAGGRPRSSALWQDDCNDDVMMDDLGTNTSEDSDEEVTFNTIKRSAARI